MKLKGKIMRTPVRIMHIDADYQVHCLLIQEGIFIQSKVSLEEALAFLKSAEFDLIVSEPHNKAIIDKSKEIGK
jgi:hypothetical protein